MRKIILIASLLFCINNYSQDYTSSQISNPNILPPEVSSFQKVNFLPVSNYTGRAKIDIPFYEIFLGGLKIPIGLSYNTGGVKPNDVASCVGLNWSLNAGGVISRTIKSYDDFDRFQLGFLSNYNNRIISIFNQTQFIDFYRLSESSDLPDEFNVSAPNMNFSFIHNPGFIQLFNDPSTPFKSNDINGANQNGQYINLRDDLTPFDQNPFILNEGNDYDIQETYDENIPIGRFGFTDGCPSCNYSFWVNNNDSFDPNYSEFGIKSFSVNTNDGFSYIFDKIDTSQSVIDKDALSIHTINYAYPPLSNLGSVRTTVTTDVNIVSYHLSKIVDKKTNTIVEFQYETYTQTFSEIMDNNITRVNYNNYNSNAIGLWQKYPKLNRLKKIIFDKGHIDFNYDLNRDDLPGEKALKEIVLYDKKNNQIKKATLNFEYFQSWVQQTSPYSKRLKLKEVVFQGTDDSSNEKYKMTYNNTALPLRMLAVTDLFGYHNGSANTFQYSLQNNQYVTTPPLTDSMPNPIAWFHPNNGQFSFLPEPINADAEYITGNYSLSPNLNFCKAGILERIDYPTGGYTSLDYELNSFKINNHELQGGGLRVKQQKISDGNSIRTIKYQYTLPDGSSSGAISNMPKFIDFDYNVNNNAPLVAPLPNTLTGTQFNSWFSLMKSNYPKQNIELTNGSFIGYSRVKVFEENNGYTIFDYTSPTSFPNTQADVVWNAYTNTPSFTYFPPFGKILYDNGKLDFHFDNDVFRGKILKESIFDNFNNLIKETQYQYTTKQFKNMLLVKGLGNIFQNYSFVPQHEGDTPPWIPFQYGYIKQRRFLLTNIIENEYFNGSIVSKDKSITYDENFSLIKSDILNDGLNVFKNEYFYPFDPIFFNEYGFVSLMTGNRFGERVLTNKFKNSIKLLEEKVIYGSCGPNSLLILPKKVIKHKTGSTNNEGDINSIEITLRDEKGNILETTDKAGIKTSFIWGYNKTEVIAKLENTPYTSIYESLRDNCQLQSNTGTEATLIDSLNTLRGAMSESLVSTYTYKPLIGVSTLTDPKGDRITYSYDSFGRLQTVKDKDGNVLSENQYNYRPN